MRQVNIKELKKNLSRELQDLPFEITKFGRVVGVVGAQEYYKLIDPDYEICIRTGIETTVKGSIPRLKLEKGCAVCGYNTLVGALEFHHIKGKKKGGIAQMNNSAVFEEMKKCVLLCSRCHREAHAGIHSQESLLLKLITEEDINGSSKVDDEKVVTTPKKEKKVVTKNHDYPVAGKIISKTDNPWFNPLINSVLAPKK